jgi:hypothetical protein
MLLSTVKTKTVIKHVASGWDLSLSLSLMINIVDESRKTNIHKIRRLFFIPLNIGDYNIELPRIYRLVKA